MLQCPMSAPLFMSRRQPCKGINKLGHGKTYKTENAFSWDSGQPCCLWFAKDSYLHRDSNVLIWLHGFTDCLIWVFTFHFVEFAVFWLKIQGWEQDFYKKRKSIQKKRKPPYPLFKRRQIWTYWIKSDTLCFSKVQWKRRKSSEKRKILIPVK